MKLCPNCRYYGKCQLQKSCKDFIKYDITDKDVVINIQEFNSKWMRRFKKWWMRFNPTILKERIEKATVVLNGLSIDEYIEEKTKQITNAVIKEVETNEDKLIG